MAYLSTAQHRAHSTPGHALLAPASDVHHLRGAGNWNGSSFMRLEPTLAGIPGLDMLRPQVHDTGVNHGRLKTEREGTEDNPHGSAGNRGLDSQRSMRSQQLQGRAW